VRKRPRSGSGDVRRQEQERRRSRNALPQVSEEQIDQFGGPFLIDHSARRAFVQELHGLSLLWTSRR